MAFRPKTRISPFAICFAGAIAFYILSSGPVAVLFNGPDNYRVSGRMSGVLSKVYAPLNPVYEEIPLYKSYVGWWIERSEEFRWRKIGASSRWKSFRP